MNFKINQELLILKILYFFELSIISCLGIYVTPFMYEWGVTATEMAVINFVANILGLFSRPFFGYLADKYQKYKELIMILGLSCGVVYLLHLASPKRIQNKVYSLNNHYSINISSDFSLITMYTSQRAFNTCWPSNLYKCNIKGFDFTEVDFVLTDLNYSYAKYFPLTYNHSSIRITKVLSCGNISHNCNNSEQFEVSYNNVGMTWSTTFWILGLTKSIGFILYSPIVSLTDAVTFVTLGPKHVHKFGFTRMFGTIGILVFSILMGGILAIMNWLSFFTEWSWVYKIQNFSQFTSCFITSAVITVAIMITSLFLKIKKSIKSENFLKTKEVKIHFLQRTSLDVLFRNWEIAVFFLFTVLGGFLLQVFAEYFFLILFKRYSSLPKYFPGVIMVVMTLSESSALGLSSLLLKYKDYEVWVSLSFLAWSLRWLSYIFVENFWFLILTEILHGPSFGIMLACLMAHISKLGTHKTQGRIQGLFAGIYFNIGGALGGLVGGLILDNFGMFGLFKCMSAISLVCTMYYPLQIYVIRRCCKSSKDLPEVTKINDDGDNLNSNLLSIELNSL